MYYCCVNLDLNGCRRPVGQERASCPGALPKDSGVTEHYVYILRSLPSGTLYVGTARNVEKRLRDHNAGRTKSTRAYRPFKLVRVECFQTLSEARKREWCLKCTPAGGKEKKRLAAGG